MIKNKTLLRRILIELIKDVYTGRTLNKTKLFVSIKMPNSTPIKHIRILFRLKKENNAIKDNMIRDIRTLFASTEEEYYNIILFVTLILNIKITMIKIKRYHYRYYYHYY